MILQTLHKRRITTVSSPPAGTGYEAETDAYNDAVIADGGTVVDIDFVDLVIKKSKEHGYSPSMLHLYSARFGVKKDAANAVSKVYSLDGVNTSEQLTGANQLIWNDDAKGVYFGNTGQQYFNNTGNIVTKAVTIFNYFIPRILGEKNVNGVHFGKNLQSSPRSVTQEHQDSAEFLILDNDSMLSRTNNTKAFEAHARLTAKTDFATYYKTNLNGTVTNTDHIANVDLGTDQNLGLFYLKIGTTEYHYKGDSLLWGIMDIEASDAFINELQGLF